MTNTQLLDSKDAMVALDVNQALPSIEAIGNQVNQIWELAHQIKVDPSYKEIDKVVVAGMGGSILGTHVIQTVFKDQLSVPITIAPDYIVPSFVNEKTLVIGSSYSGTTEETLSAFQDAHSKKAKLAVITSGGELAALGNELHIPSLVFDPIHNPSNCARMGLGYSIFGQIALFHALGLITVTDQDFQDITTAIAQVHLQAGVAVTQDSNLAKLLSFNMTNRIPVITVSEHLEGAAHVFANQLNENAKTFSEYRVVPELHHHLLEGLSFPKNNDDNLLFVVIHSELYHQRNQLRIVLTEELFEQHQLEYISHHVLSNSLLAQAFELITLGAYAAFYLAMLYNQNPIPNPNVDWIKNELKNRKA